MASIISSGTTSGTALNFSGDTSGVLQLATNGTTTALSISTAQVVTLTNALPVTSGGTGVTTSTGTGAVVLGTSPTITTPTISSLSSASATALTLQSAGTTAVTIDTSQNVGIGTSSPSTKLQVSAATPVVTVSSTGTTAASQDFTTNSAAQRTTIGVERSTGAGLFVGSSAYAAVFGSAGASSTEFATNNTIRMIIDSSGSVGIGVTPDSNYFLTVQSTSNDAKNAVKLNQGSTGGRTQISFNNPNGQVGTIQTSGSATSYNTSSDYRLKENITPMTGALAKVALLKPVTYKWKVDGSDGEGFIAHELAEVCSHAVSGAKDAVDANGNPVYQGIDVSFLVATLTAAIQELKAINDTQAETINAQSATLVALTARVTALEGA